MQISSISVIKTTEKKAAMWLVNLQLWVCWLEFAKILITSSTTFTLYKTNILSWIFIVQTHWNNNSQVDISLHSDTLSWFQANQALIPWCYVCSREAANTTFILFDLTWPTSAEIHDLSHSMLTITPLMWLFYWTEIQILWFHFVDLWLFQSVVKPVY
jgi:hypothetical protein